MWTSLRETFTPISSERTLCLFKLAFLLARHHVSRPLIGCPLHFTTFYCDEWVASDRHKGGVWVSSHGPRKASLASSTMCVLMSLSPTLSQLSLNTGAWMIKGGVMESGHLSDRPDIVMNCNWKLKFQWKSVTSMGGLDQLHENKIYDYFSNLHWFWIVPDNTV